MKLAILTAMSIEARAVAHAISLRSVQGSLAWRGSCAGHTVELHTTGMGQVNMIRCAREHCTAGQVDAALITGLCGGLRPSLVTGDLIRVRQCIRAQAGDKPVQFDFQACDHTLLTVDQPIANPQDKAAMHAATQADAVDMETYAVAKWLTEQGVPVAALRFVADTAAMHVPSRLLALADTYGQPSAGKAAITMLLHPTVLPHAMRLRTATNQALAAMGRLLPDAINSFIESIESRSPAQAGKLDSNTR